MPSQKYFYLAQKLASVDISQLSIQSISTKYVYLPYTTPQECPPPWPQFDRWALMSMMLEVGDEHSRSQHFPGPGLLETKANMKMSDGGYKRSHCDTFYTEESLNCSSSFPQRKHGNTKILSFIKTFHRVSVSPLPIMRLVNARVKLKKMTKLYNYHYTCIYTSLLY